MADETKVIELLDTAVAAMGGQSRPGQHEMTRQVVQSLESGKHLLVQAGTGTGKSMAYLIPALAHALESEKPVIISTATLALQAQIVGRDVPRLLETLKNELPRPMKVSLVKGRANYVCKYKLGGGYPDEDEGALFSLTDEAPMRLPGGDGPGSALGQEIVRVREWAEYTDSGDRDDLTPGVSDRAWRQVSVSAMDCLGAQKCPMAAECFSELARAQAADADVVITNHAMLAVSAFEGLAVLPDFDTVIIDEAHELQDRVTSSVTRPLSVSLVQTAASAARKNCAVAVEPLNQAAKALARSLEGVPTGLLPQGLNEEQSAAIQQVGEAARVALSDSKPEPNNAVDGGRQMARSQLTYLVEQASRLLEAQDAREVVWASRPGQFTPGQGYVQPDETTQPTLNVAPLSVAGRLREGLFDGRTVVLTSATLAIGSAFEPVAGALGLLGESAPEWSGIDVGSPFNYAQQGMLYVAGHLPKPGRQMAPELLDEIEDLIRASGGGALALFTSRRAAEEAAEALRPRLEYDILCQGDSSMKSLVDQFSAERDTCLFGTMTLWQGVDVPGPSCRLVIIDKIPFPRPDDPLSSARSRDIARHGGNGFMAVAATFAAVRLAQGAGRLIRAMDDRGVVAVLDPRLATERYGSFLRSSLPPMWKTQDKATVLGALKRLAGTPAA
ncbi:ATP-dependent DNA helicase [Paeniglutamicibacter cryotolerans]|uniref:ATP-dependent helicase DinG n=1 Tax=Paeniglutamicibacter cryotolerans TaxID=670079 RepID=A0A839QSF5_9MICC|nr:ATP-dependent DNA helicase [Paeniglutamicibacter cryotolerans]MBB2996192.1 ATP-dependent DNA helicase DinG [Paeniglutamicibacter cryotolerans]